jgi:hypothetical protein
LNETQTVKIPLLRSKSAKSKATAAFGDLVLSSDKKKHRRKVKTHWAKKRRRASRALRRRGR